MTGSPPPDPTERRAWLIDSALAAVFTGVTWRLAWRTTVTWPLDLALSVLTFVAVLLLLRALRT
ncbi:hypothetical protein [Deinococcus maricopensis]|uniref:Uncharacterized protein n=1 Tax=Deinococcus maricopensis (strain DSM 21211 / LMG 22137 / NRRL B-23946 / LB-34) TaxID=709986 RepID=E8U7P3_DEIML|nr:hypothetical protein [Deinococcus maricopensis]ADV67082.1 hypothetical protein Deima_1433 [Deinococcus maricopensis DSM 21211]